MKREEEVYANLASLLSPGGAAAAAGQGKHRSSTTEIADGLKRIRRVLLTEGLPEIVRLSTLS